MSETNWQVAGAEVDHGPYRPVATLIEEQADRTPERTALVHRGETETALTYAEFDALANGLATELTSAGVREGDLVPLMIGNSVELPLCMVALMKLGAVFVPCDPAWPEERLRTVLKVLDPPLSLTTGSLVPTDGRSRVVSHRTVVPSTVRPTLRPAPDRPVYGVFTSGTTGVPKCAVNLHGGLTNRFRFMSRYFAATGDEVVLQNSRHTFDSAIWQLLWPLTTGGRTIVPEQGEFLDLERTVDTIARYGVTVTDFVPAILGMLVALLEAEPEHVARIASLRDLVVGGEEIIPHAVHRLRELVPGLGITNGYGPSEASIGMVFHRVDGTEGDHIPLGRPIDNCYALIDGADADGVGEILVGGACLGAGYLGEPELTAEAFVPHPFPGVPGERLYRTGDLGRFDDSGLLRFVGRRDRQAQVDGVRIELREIETTAESCPGVIQAKALTLRRSGRTRLVVAAAAEEGTTPAALRGHLASLLPRVQVPRHCFVLQALPLTDNGKVDLRALRTIVEEKLGSGTGTGTGSETGPGTGAGAGTGAEPDATTGAGATTGASAGGDAGLTPAERVAEVMGVVLDRPGFGVRDDFLDHGGDSLTALTAALRLRETLGARVGISDLYAYRTPAALAAAVPGGGATVLSAGDEAELMERDADLPEELAALARRAAGTRPVVPPRTVLVTGATGFVGARAVHALLAATEARVVCVVRARDDAHARLRLREALGAQGLWDESLAGRLDARRGDLARDRFGWTRETWEAYAARCDAVLHIGALVNFLLDYRAHRPANVSGTTEVVRFALSGRTKALHHVSTLGVLDREASCARERGRGRLGEDVDPARAATPTSGYSRSKWVAERLVLAARRLGAPVTLYRLGEIMPAADNGVPNPKALTHLLLSAFRRLGLRPDVPMRSDYTPVDEAVARLVAGLAEPAGGAVHHVFRDGGADFTSFALTEGERTVPVREFMAALRAAAAEDVGSEAAVLDAVLTLLPTSGPDGTPDFGRLLTDNPVLFTREACTALDARHGLREGPLEAALAAYRTTLTQ
ncbi:MULTISPECIES: non-ribosomal peptide synthetase [unclassified Streptomyces]|uniref:non-ribosomal peptide synthetase n=1 Tax=unclassified Streptomyces TaxID=2593676 RepID=UPI002E76E475|nr:MULTISPECIES: amino acid adenylation domain-containing protein [unclassified Streptomyces]MEE1760885.1 amino acid adenylation domain-containing protein [Streptomyces sp. SP18BB07]MEE1836262.1 amino acid adenylation domain-containing protein [Streptomyces sp. SP17KL33]